MSPDVLISMRRAARNGAKSQLDFERRLDIATLTAMLGFRSIMQAAATIGVPWWEARQMYWAGKIQLNREPERKFNWRTIQAKP